MKWLRPVSQASDMSAIQDGLWLTRCKPFLERFSSLSQFGGKYDAIALLVAVMLHVQIRDYQGLMSYVLFADMKQAFDVANKDLMLYMCYLAGITATEWLLLYDFFITLSLKCMLRGEGVGGATYIVPGSDFITGEFLAYNFQRGGGSFFWMLEGEGCSKHYFDPHLAYIKGPLCEPPLPCIFFQSGQSCRPSWGVLNWYDEICSRYPARPSV